MLYPVLLLLAIIVVIILIVLFFVRTYDSLDIVQEASASKFKRQKDLSNRLEKRFDDLTKANANSIEEVKTDLQKRVKSIKQELERINQEISWTVKMVNEEDDKIREEIHIVDENARMMNEEMEHQFQDLRVEVESNDDNISHLRAASDEAELKREELMNTIKDLEEVMIRELDLLDNKILETQMNLDSHEKLFAEHKQDFKAFKEETSTEINSLKASVSALKEQMSSTKIKIANYAFEYDQVTRNLNLTYFDEANPDRRGILNVDQIEANNTVSDFAVVKEANIQGKATFQRETDTDQYELLRGNGGLNVRMPTSGSVRFNTMNVDMQPDVKHSFSSDGTAEHEKVIAPVVETPYLDFGRYVIVEKDNQLILRDTSLNVDTVLSKNDTSAVV